MSVWLMRTSPVKIANTSSEERSLCSESPGGFEITPSSISLKVTPSLAELRTIVRAMRSEGKRIGLVPTMGALHSGHVSLIKAARAESDFVIVTIFVNPTQFGPNEDFQKYPRPLEKDVAACAEAGADLVFTPSVNEVYPQPFFTVVDVTGISEVLEGACRPGHFKGVATVVLKLFNMTQPDVAFFGQKDFQQQLLIRRMVSELDLPVDIRVCPTVRESDGLALSSRNIYLSEDDRKSALALSRALRHAESRLKGGETDLAKVRNEMHEILNSTPNLKLEYATIVDPDSIAELDRPQRLQVAVIAARVGTTRLIDNLPIEIST